MNENNSSQLICTEQPTYEMVKKDDRRKRSISGPLPDNLVDILEDCDLSSHHLHLNAIQLQSKLHSPNNHSSNSSHLNNSSNSNVSSQLNNSNNSNQLNLSTRSNTSNESNRSNDSSTDFSSQNHDRKSSQVLNYLFNQQSKSPSDPRSPNSKQLSPFSADDYTTPEKRNSSQAHRDYRTNSVDNRVRYMSGGDASPNNIYRSNLFSNSINRPRSNSEGKSKKPNMIMSTLRKPFHLPWQTKHSNQSSSCPITPNSLEHKTMMSINEENSGSRSRENSGGSSNGNNGNGQSYKSRFPIVDRFRMRSLSMGYHDLNRKCDAEGNDNLPNSLPRRHSVDPEQNHVNGKKHRAKSVDFADIHQSHFSLYREPRVSRNGSFNPFTSTESICDHLDFEDLQKDESLIYLKFFKFYLCYDLIPKSSKLVVFDTQLIVKKAFYALVNHGVRAAPLWCSEEQSYVGMLTITYFINVLINSYNNSEIKVNELEEQKIESWKNLLEDKRTLITIDPESSVLDAIETLIKNKIHRLPIVDPLTNNVIYILTHKRILKFFFLYCYYLPMPSYMNFSLKEVDIGTYSNIELITLDAKVIDAMRKLVERRVSALPVVDENNKLVDIYSKFDIFNLAAEKLYDNLDMTIKEALQYREHWFEGVVKCTVQDRFITVLERIVKAEVHRIVVVDEEDHVVGIISLSDILQFLTLRPIQLFSKKLIPREPISENLDEELFNYNNNNDYSLLKNSIKEKELELGLCTSVYNSELQKIDEI